MGYPPGEKNGEIGFGQVIRLKQEVVGMKVIPDMIERHDHYYDATQQVDGFNSRLRGCCHVNLINYYGQKRQHRWPATELRSRTKMYLLWVLTGNLTN